ncbi:MAG: glycosyltransferase family 4 protein [Gemmatimonadales bacterium]
MTAVAAPAPARPVEPRRTLLMVISEDWFFWSHRRALALAAHEAGFDVVIAAPERAHADAIRGLGLTLVPLRELDRRSRRPVQEWRTVRELVRVYREVRPDLVHHVTIKPVLYGSLAARLAGVPAVINGIYGLGHVFSGRGQRAALLRTAVTAAYRASFRLLGRRLHVTFENAADRDRFIRLGICRTTQASVIRGMGFDPVTFHPRPFPAGEPVVMMAGRLLWSKGVRQLVEAVARARANGAVCRLALVGAPDPGNPAAVPESQLREWAAAGAAEWWGHRSDMPQALEQATIVALPSAYAEGLPKVLIEAAAVGRPLVATDIPGCREIVRDGENGYLVPSDDVPALAGAIDRLVRDRALRERFGRRSHELSVEFTDAVVNRETLELYHALLAAERRP